MWEEIRNFKKCLIMMFAKQDKDVVFLETVVGLAKQRRHCMIECIPLPQGIAKEAPLYFKKVKISFPFVPPIQNPSRFSIYYYCSVCYSCRHQHSMFKSVLHHIGLNYNIVS